MPDNPPMDGRPEVQIRSTIRTPGTDLSGRTMLVTHQVACVWCPGYSTTPDVREAVKYADDHEMSLAHTHSREEALAEGRSRRELWD